MPVGNFLSLARNPATYSGSTVYSNTTTRNLANRYGAVRAAYISTAAGPGFNKHGRPSGAEPPYCWVTPPKGGGLAAFNGVGSASELSASLALGKELAASVGMSSDITSAALSLVVSLTAALGSASTLSGSMKGVVTMAATIGMSGNISAALGLIAWCNATLGMTGGMAGSNLTGLAHMEATLRSYTDLTAEGVRDAVWKALADNFLDPGTMGALLNAAGSGGMDPALVQKIVDLWQRFGLDPANPMTSSDDQVQAGDVTIDMVEGPPGTITSTRQP